MQISGFRSWVLFLRFRVDQKLPVLRRVDVPAHQDLRQLCRHLFRREEGSDRSLLEAWG